MTSLAAVLLFALSTIGLTHIIVDSSLFQPVRGLLKKILPEKIYQVFECYQCAGTWCGFICGAIFIDWSIFVVLGCGFAGSFLAMWGAALLNYLDAKSVIDIGEEEVD